MTKVKKKLSEATTKLAEQAKEKETAEKKTSFDKMLSEGRVVEATVDYIGFDVPKAFVVGYGLDYKQLYRNLPYVGVLKREVYDPAHADKVDTIDITPEH